MRGRRKGRKDVGFWSAFFFRSCRRCSYVKRVRSKEIWAYSLKKALAICNIKMCGWP